MDLEARAKEIAFAPWAYASLDISAIIEELLTALQCGVALGVEADGPDDGSGQGLPVMCAQR